MLAVSDLVSFGGPPELAKVWSQHVQDLTDIQERAVRAGALDGRTNLLVVAPTSSGKTFVGELAATSSAYSRRQHAIFIVPFRALADEHFELFRRRYSDHLSVVISTSDWTEFDADVRAGNFNLAVMTYEKLMSFLAQQPDILTRCTTLVVDEVQLLSEPGRGAQLELLLTQVILAEGPPQIVALSASLDEMNGLDAWLRSRLVSSSERPIPLTESVCAPSGLAVVRRPGSDLSNERLTGPQGDRESLVVALAKQYTADGKQVIIFRTTVNKVLETSRSLRGGLRATGVSQRVDERLNDLDDSDARNELRLCLASGVGFHNADLTHPERQLVEDAFRSGEVRALVATTTLAIGVNLPTDAVIVSDSTRFSPGRSGWNRTNILVSEYRNASGRAGRLGQRTAGYSVLVAENAIEQRQLVNSYLLGPIEPVVSQIPRRPFADVIFDIICAEIADTEAAAVEFISSTFAYMTFYEGAGGGIAAIQEAVGAAIRECVASGLVVQDGLRLAPTDVARVLGAAGLSLRSASQLASALERAVAVTPCRQEILFEVASCEEVGDRPWLVRRNSLLQRPTAEQVPNGADCSQGSRLATALSRSTFDRAEAQALVRTRCLLDWMTGDSYRTLSARFRNMGAAAARVRDLGKYAAWLLDALGMAAQVRDAPAALLELIRSLALEARYGVPAPLAPLARLGVRGISRGQLLRLYQSSDGIPLYEPENILDTRDDVFVGLLTPLQLSRLREAIVRDLKESIQRKRAGHLARADEATLARRLIDDLYVTGGGALEQAVTDVLTHIGLSVERVLRQPHGEEDMRVAHDDGTVIVSVTASQQDTRPIRWNKAKEILGAGTGLNPINCVCVGRPNFESLAERSARNLARETGARSLLLVPISVLSEAILRIAEGVMRSQQLGDLLAHQRGVLTIEDLPSDGEG